MKEVINQKKKIEMPDRFNIGGATITDKYAIAQQFNNFYVNIGNNLSKDIPANGGDPVSYISSVIPDSIFLESVDESEIVTICRNLKVSSAGWDQILPKVVKLTYHNFIVPITHVMNLSIIHGVVPTELKLAKVVPIYKSRDRGLTSAVLRLECSLDCVSGSVGHQHHSYRLLYHSQRLPKQKLKKNVIKQN